MGVATALFFWTRQASGHARFIEPRLVLVYGPVRRLGRMGFLQRPTGVLGHTRLLSLCGDEHSEDLTESTSHAHAICRAGIRVQSEIDLADSSYAKRCRTVISDFCRDLYRSEPSRTVGVGHQCLHRCRKNIVG